MLTQSQQFFDNAATIQQIESVGQLNKPDANDNATVEAVNDQSMFVLTISEKKQKDKIKIFSRKRNGIINNGILP